MIVLLFIILNFVFQGTDVVEGIALVLCKLTGDLYLSSNSFPKMTNTRFLKIHDSCWPNKFNVYLPNGLKSLSYKLRYLEWDGFCLESLSSNFCAEQLVEIHMWDGKLKKLWDGFRCEYGYNIFLFQFLEVRENP